MDQEIIETDAGRTSIDATRLWGAAHAKLDEALEYVWGWLVEDVDDERIDAATCQHRLDHPVAVQSALAIALGNYIVREGWWIEFHDACVSWSDDDQPPRPLHTLLRAVIDYAKLPDAEV